MRESEHFSSSIKNPLNFMNQKSDTMQIEGKNSERLFASFKFLNLKILNVVR